MLHYFQFIIQRLQKSYIVDCDIKLTYYFIHIRLLISLFVYLWKVNY